MKKDSSWSDNSKFFDGMPEGKKINISMNGVSVGEWTREGNIATDDLTGMVANGWKEFYDIISDRDFLHTMERFREAPLTQFFRDTPLMVEQKKIWKTGIIRPDRHSCLGMRSVGYFETKLRDLLFLGWHLVDDPKDSSKLYNMFTGIYAKDSDTGDLYEQEHISLEMFIDGIAPDLSKNLFNMSVQELEDALSEKSMAKRYEVIGGMVN